ncbi:pre-peptidase C-terminal domain-containing protein [Anaerosporobacter sp.]|uniref:pre-peptidase C-terminal domain-containing protein n=1 Tax=Anaerosporobacter sp. TaxID=1872529 RepID=UPI00286EE6F3|nr:pre-peptidase C-terminal domain-containing protein [Anaerosporobacter sp.]
MNSKVKKVLCSLVFALALLVTSVLAPVNAQAAIIYDDSDVEVTELATLVLTTGTEANREKVATYMFQTTMENEVIPIKITTKGYMDYAVAASVSASTDVGIYTDETCTVQAGNIAYISTSSDQISEGVYGNSGYAYFSKAGTYYVKCKTPGTYGFTSQMYNGANRTLKDNTYTTAYGYDYDKYNYDSREIYYKYVPTKTGYITVSTEHFEDYGSNNITLCNSSKKAISNEVYTSPTSTYSKKAVFAVKKGTTYYIKARTSSKGYRIKCKVTGVTESSGAKKTSAKTLTIGKAKKGVILSEDKTTTSDWYKFTLTKATKLNLVVMGNCSSGNLKVELTSASIGGSVKFTISSTDYEGSKSLETYTSKSLPKGTYYIRVYKDDKKASGNYSIKVSK